MIKEVMKINKPTLIIAFVLISLFFLAINNIAGPVPKVPSPTATPTPLRFDRNKINLETTDLTVIGINPDVDIPFSDRFQPIEITFNKSINESTIRFILSPNNRVTTNFYKTKVGYSFLQIVPLDPWNDMQSYELTLSKDIQTETGVRLGKDIIVNFRVEAYKGL